MVTDGHQRPEIPPDDACPSPSFPGMGKYVELMNNCWKQVRNAHASRMGILLIVLIAAWCDGYHCPQPAGYHGMGRYGAGRHRETWGWGFTAANCAAG